MRVVPVKTLDEIIQISFDCVYDTKINTLNPQLDHYKLLAEMRNIQIQITDAVLHSLCVFIFIFVFLSHYDGMGKNRKTLVVGVCIVGTDGTRILYSILNCGYRMMFHSVCKLGNTRDRKSTSK